MRQLQEDYLKKALGNKRHKYRDSVLSTLKHQDINAPLTVPLQQSLKIWGSENPHSYKKKKKNIEGYAARKGKGL